MKKKLLFMPFLILGLIGCSTTLSDNPDESGNTPTTPDSVPGPADHEHTYSTDWSSNETHHWHECTTCGDKKDYEEHDYHKTAEDEEYETYTCSVCAKTYQKQKTEPAYSALDLMNQAISGESFIDPFAVRDYLLAQTDDRYNFNDTLADGSKYGYSLTHGEVIEHKNGVVTKPAAYANDAFVSYETVDVNSFGGLYEAVRQINEGEKSYSTIKLSQDITQTELTGLVQYRAPKCIELDLNNHSILAPTAVNKNPKDEKWFTLQFLDNTFACKAYIHGGTIQANRTMKADGVEDDSCCISLASGDSFRLTDLSLVAQNGTQCIGDLSQYVTNHSDYHKKVYIDGVDMSAPLRAMTIAAGTWTISNINDTKSIRGMVVIDGGNVTIDNVKVDASNSVILGLNDYPQGFLNSDLDDLHITHLNGVEVDITVPQVLKNYYGAVSFNDAICVCSRRFASYSTATVSVSNSTLIPVLVNNEAVGFGFRYYDLANNGDGASVPSLTSNYYPEEKGNGFGGYYLSTI